MPTYVRALTETLLDHKSQALSGTPFGRAPALGSVLAPLSPVLTRILLGHFQESHPPFIPAQFLHNPPVKSIEPKPLRAPRFPTVLLGCLSPLFLRPAWSRFSVPPEDPVAVNSPSITHCSD